MSKSNKLLRKEAREGRRKVKADKKKDILGTSGNLNKDVILRILIDHI